MKNSGNFFAILLRIPVPWVFVLTYIVGALIQFFIPVPVNSPTIRIISQISGALLFCIGSVFAGWSLIIFHKSKTTTTPGESSVVLVTWGPYRFSRNPMYVSLILCYLGEAGLLVQLIPVILLPLTVAYVNFIVIPLEETRLKEDFKDTYIEYCAKVSRWL